MYLLKYLNLKNRKPLAEGGDADGAAKEVLPGRRWSARTPAISHWKNQCTSLEYFKFLAQALVTWGIWAVGMRPWALLTMTKSSA